MASFRDYEAVQTATVELFHGESLQVRSVSSPEFMIKALPLHRERATKQDLTAEDETRINLGIAFALVESWTFDDELTLENFIAMLESPSYAPIAGEICKRIDRAGCNMDSFVKKKVDRLIEWLKRSWEIDRPTGNGSETRRQALEKIRKQTGRKPKSLDIGEPPHELLYILKIFNQIDAGGKVDWVQIDAWQRVSGIKLSQLEIDVILAVIAARG